MMIQPQQHLYTSGIQNRRGKNIGGNLPLSIPVSKFFPGLTHRAKCVTDTFLEMTNSKVSLTHGNKLDVLRILYDYFCMYNETNLLS